MIHCHARVSLPEKCTLGQATDGAVHETQDSDTKDLEPIDEAIQSKHSTPLSPTDDTPEIPVRDSFPQDVSPDVKVVETTSGLEPVIREGEYLVEDDGYESRITLTVSGW